MPIRKAEAEWKGGLKDGKGNLKAGQRGVRGPLFVPGSLRGRNEHEPRGADRRGARGVLLDGAERGSHRGGEAAGADPYGRERLAGQGRGWIPRSRRSIS